MTSTHEVFSRVIKSCARDLNEWAVGIGDMLNNISGPDT